MASQRSDIFDLVSRLEESARRGDWTMAGELAASLRRHALPDTPEEIGEYLHRLEKALIVAKTSRAHAAATLVRLNAAARFNGISVDFTAPRQDFGRVADS